MAEKKGYDDPADQGVSISPYNAVWNFWTLLRRQHERDLAFGWTIKVHEARLAPGPDGGNDRHVLIYLCQMGDNQKHEIIDLRPGLFDYYPGLARTTMRRLTGMEPANA